MSRLKCRAHQEDCRDDDWREELKEHADEQADTIGAHGNYTALEAEALLFNLFDSLSRDNNQCMFISVSYVLNLPPENVVV